MLYICATPIGNLADISHRAIEVLSKADYILCEDTRNSHKLLNHYGINNKRLIALHEHNENEVAKKVIDWLDQGLSLVQISDAGTPGISDPGARLTKLVMQHGHKISPLPGACAFISLLSVAGIINNSTLFVGFLANKPSQRQRQLSEWKNVDYVVAIYESPHRIIDNIEDICSILGESREVVMGRELTKQFETIKRMPARKLLEFIKQDPNQQRGEFVLLILPEENTNNNSNLLSEQQISALELISKELPAKKAVNLTQKLFGGNKDLMYQYLLDNKESKGK